MTTEEMIAILVKSSGGTRTKADIEAMLDDSVDEAKTAKEKALDKYVVFTFLETLRKSGAINMFGAPQVLEDQLGLSKKDAKAYFKEWSETYEHPE